jgi:hypothetical protein
VGGNKSVEYFISSNHVAEEEDHIKTGKTDSDNKY